jgi:predicted O-methyltransferase YrrM
VALTHEAEGWREYKMEYRNPHKELEPPEREIAAVNGALEALARAGMLPHTRYDLDKFSAHRKAVRELFEIPWTGITPRMQRLIYAINAIVQPPVMVAMGVFVGNTFISNAGAAVGPGACYRAERLVGIEIDPKPAAIAMSNVAKIDPEGRCEILAMDGVDWLRQYDGTIDLLYSDANGSYLKIQQEAERNLRPGALCLAHNSVNMPSHTGPYLDHVRNQSLFRESMNVVIDGEGLEVTMR